MSRAILVIAVLVCLTTGCTRDTAPGIVCQSCAANAVSFSNDIIPIFNANCNISGCHNTIDDAGRVNLDPANAYATVTEPGKGYVVKNNANYSLLYSQLLVGANNHMPNNGRQLDACDIQKIYCWINQGGLNN